MASETPFVPRGLRWKFCAPGVNSTIWPKFDIWWPLIDHDIYRFGIRKILLPISVDLFIPFLTFRAIRPSVDPCIPLFKIRTKLAIYWSLPLFFKIRTKSVVRVSLHYSLKTWTDSVVHKSLPSPLKIRTKSAVCGSLPSSFSNLDRIGGPWIPTFLFLKIQTKSAIRGSLHSLHPLFKIRTDSIVRGTLHPPIENRTKSAVHGSLYFTGGNENDSSSHFGVDMTHFDFIIPL